MPLALNCPWLDDADMATYAAICELSDRMYALDAAGDRAGWLALSRELHALVEDQG